MEGVISVVGDSSLGILEDWMIPDGLTRDGLTLELNELNRLLLLDPKAEVACPRTFFLLEEDRRAFRAAMPEVC